MKKLLNLLYFIFICYNCSNTPMPYINNDQCTISKNDLKKFRDNEKYCDLALINGNLNITEEERKNNITIEIKYSLCYVAVYSCFPRK